jgi:hypothetical protein
MSNVIDFVVEKAVRQRGISRELAKQMIADGFDPLDPSDIGEHGDWFSVSGELEIEHTWTQDALDKLLKDLKDLTD